MGMTTNLIVLSFCLSFAIYMGTPAHHSSLFFDIVTGHTSQLYERLSSELAILLAISTLAGVAVMAAGQGVSYALFTGISIFLLSFVTLPVDVIFEADMPIEIKTLLVGVFGIMYVMSILSWFKGGTDM